METLEEIQEIWKDIPRCEGKYMVSNLGRIKSLPILMKGNVKGGKPVYTKGRILVNGTSRKGYKIFRSKDLNGKMINNSVHRLVAQAFIPNPENKPEVNHIDANKENNSVENLEWATRKENMTHAKNNLLMGEHKGVQNHASKLNDEKVRFIRLNYLKIDRKELAQRFGVSKTAIYQVVKGIKWNHVI